MAKLPTRNQPYVNAPVRNTPATQNFSPISTEYISVSDTGVVNMSKGYVYYDFNGAETRASRLYFKILVTDEYGNLVDLLRNSNIDDESEQGSYVDNQIIRSLPSRRITIIDGAASNNSLP